MSDQTKTVEPKAAKLIKITITGPCPSDGYFNGSHVEVTPAEAKRLIDKGLAIKYQEPITEAEEQAKA